MANSGNCTVYSSSLSGMAQRVISREGVTVSLYQLDNITNYDPSTGLNTTSTPVLTQIKAAFLDYPSLSYGLMTRNGNLIEVNDKQVYMSPLDINGNALTKKLSSGGDYVIDPSGKKWRIVNVKEYNLTGSCPIMYELQVRA